MDKKFRKGDWKKLEKIKGEIGIIFQPAKGSCPKHFLLYVMTLLGPVALVEAHLFGEKPLPLWSELLQREIHRFDDSVNVTIFGYLEEQQPIEKKGNLYQFPSKKGGERK
ncbi:MAG: hypothetical protein UY41_C0011G0007 [Candidatus Moranbacteria bacterium GW2011_GWE1_49_15]|nr:MAG: hypothetical protein UY41_C0011G0007 [Candidatus Moranbacteria bacterium GW2011_GWE1_49_15]HBP01407.1 hypothetical protein [Candidatus Moranbacteria bacterium]